MNAGAYVRDAIPRDGTQTHAHACKHSSARDKYYIRVRTLADIAPLPVCLFVCF